MGDGIFVTSNELESMILNENINYIDNIDGIKIYSFSTFDSLKEYTEVNNLEEYSKPTTTTTVKNLFKQDISRTSKYFTKLRSTLKKRKTKEEELEDQRYNNKNTSKMIQNSATTSEKTSKIKLEKMDNEDVEAKNQTKRQSSSSSSTYSLIWQPKVNENISISYDYDDASVLTTEKKVKTNKCGKEHCNYGCICDTISNTTSITRDHCGRYECMFECICSSRSKQRNHDSESYSNDDKSSTKGSSSYNNAARRSKRQKYLSLKAFEQSDAIKASPVKRTRAEVASNEVCTRMCSNKKINSSFMYALCCGVCVYDVNIIYSNYY